MTVIIKKAAKKLINKKFLRGGPGGAVFSKSAPLAPEANK
jgi:hypothetical protein